MMQVREMILEILKDGNWHGLGEIINHARKIITPERASQLYLCGGGKTKKLLGRPLEDQIDFGIRWEVLKQSVEKHPKEEIRKTGNLNWVNQPKCKW
jgi:hypothetical protein